MTFVKFFGSNGKLTGYEVRGHATASANDETGKLVCSAVSSAAYMAANTLTDIIKANVKLEEKDGYMSIILCDKFDESAPILQGLRMHMENLARQYTDFISFNSEV